MLTQHKYFLILLGFLSCWFNILFSQQIVINEFLASNKSTQVDQNGKSSDWIELYNASDSTINLVDFGLTDDPKAPFKWRYPDITLNPQSFLLIWASDNDTASTTELHTNFKLDADGEFLGIYNSSGVILDSLSFGPQTTDISFGRTPDGNLQWSFFNKPTPGYQNDNSSYVVEKPVFLKEQGNYSEPFSLELSTADTNLSIYYTLDCTLPEESGQLYTQPIEIKNTTIVRAICKDKSGITSQIVSKTYFLNEPNHLPALSLVTDPYNLWDPDSGIYMNTFEWGSEWERPASFAFISKEKGVEFSIDAGIRIHGDATRSRQKISFRIYFRNEYGASRLDYKVFNLKSNTSFKRLVLHSCGQDHPASTYYWIFMRNPLMYRLHAEVQPTCSDSRPLILYINGKLWGIYYFHERLDEYFVEDNFQLKNFDMIKNTPWHSGGEVICGEQKYWQDTFNFVIQKFMGNPVWYDSASKLIDIQNFTDHHIFNIFGANWDWPHGNMVKFTDRTLANPWKWIMWDEDAVFGRHDRGRMPDWNALEWATRSEVRLDLNDSDASNMLWSTEMLREFLESSNYRIYFINRYCDLLNTSLNYEHINHVLDSLAAIIEPDVQLELDRWLPEHPDVQSWYKNIDFVKRYVLARNDYSMRHLKEKFHLNSWIKITLESSPVNAGRVQISTIIPTTYPWQGTYFKDLPLAVVARPNPGYRFLHWEGADTSRQDSMTIFPKQDLVLRPVFHKLTNPPQISNIKIDSIRSTSAVILFQTDQPAIGQIHYSSDNKFNFVSSPEQNEKLDHQIKLNGLNPGILYNFKIHVRNNEGDSDSSSTGSFTTLDSIFLTLKVTSISAENITPVSAHIIWETERPATSQVFWGETENLNFFTEIDTQAVVHHSIVLNDLLPQTKYYFKVKSTDSYENQILSELQQFITGDTTQLRISQIAADEIKLNSVKIIWATNKSSIAQINYGTNPDSLNKVENDSSWQLGHEIILKNLAENSIYYFQVKSFDQDKKSVVSPIFNFSSSNDLEKRQLDMVYEIELMLDRSTGFYEAPGWNFGENGTAGMNIHIQKSGNYKITSRVKGIQDDNVSPEMAILLDSLTIIQKSITFSNFDTLSTISAIDSGNHFVQIRLENDPPDTIQHATLIGDWLKFSFLPETGVRLENKLGENTIELTNNIQNYPNPVNNSTIISYRIVKAAPVKIKIYNLAGQEVLTLVDAPHDAGNYKLTWNGENLYGSPVASGLYLLKLETPSAFLVSRIVLLK
ncbi:CotH kinase family protein [candidate division KSB1 bacterium]|nr:CotH kinase family protein [candidate division KSB1 bacterium]